MLILWCHIYIYIYERMPFTPVLHHYTPKRVTSQLHVHATTYTCLGFEHFHESPPPLPPFSYDSSFFFSYELHQSSDHILAIGADFCGFPLNLISGRPALVGGHGTLLSECAPRRSAEPPSRSPHTNRKGHPQVLIGPLS